MRQPMEGVGLAGISPEASTLSQIHSGVEALVEGQPGRGLFDPLNLENPYEAGSEPSSLAGGSSEVNSAAGKLRLSARLQRPLAKLAVAGAIFSGASVLAATEDVTLAQARTLAPHIYDYNMFAPENLAPGNNRNNCGPNAFADAISYVLQRRVTPHQVQRHVRPWYNGEIRYHNGPYATPAMNHLGKVYNVKEYHTNSLEKGMNAVRKLGAAMVILADIGPVTSAGHYLAVVKGKDGKTIVLDPNGAQADRSRPFDHTHYSVNQLRYWLKISNQAWVVLPPKSNHNSTSTKPEQQHHQSKKSKQHHTRTGRETSSTSTTTSTSTTQKPTRQRKPGHKKTGKHSDSHVILTIGG